MSALVIHPDELEWYLRRMHACLVDLAGLEQVMETDAAWPGVEIVFCKSQQRDLSSPIQPQGSFLSSTSLSC